MTSRKSFHRRLAISASALSIGLATMPAGAQEVPETAGGDIVVTGTRFGGRVVTDSPTPIDSIKREELTGSGATELQGMLKVVVPSFSTSRPVAANAADFLEPPTLRGLSPGQLLVLVNGKRRHYSASLNLGNQIGRGDVAYDFNAIPALALSRIEVLRDGAAAQYGSDAIAGVLNLVLDDGLGTIAQAQYGQTTHGDGRNVDVGASTGLKLGAGTIRLTANYQNQQGTDRATPDTRQQYFGIGAGGAPVAPSANYGSGTGLTPSNGALDPREATFDRNVWVFGEPKYENIQLFGNAKMPLGDTVELYAFGGYSRLNGVSVNFFRRAGQDETVRALYPDGFLPKQKVVLENYSAAAGIRGDLGDVKWDLSSVYGRSAEDFSYFGTANVSLGAASPTQFYIRGARYSQWTSNFDLAYEKDLFGDGAPVKLAGGLEYRQERLGALPGDPASYQNGGVTIQGGPNNGRPAAIGAQPGAGLTPVDAVGGRRHSWAAYGEVEKTWFDRWLITAALRHEDFSDFGTTTDFKVASRFDLIKGFSLRGSYGTGFRAPTLQQSFASQTATQFVNGVVQRVRVIPLSDPIAPLVGATPLRPEQSNNLSLGMVLQPASNFTFSMDYYNIRIKDRIVISSNFGSTALTTFLASRGSPNISSVAYLTNAVDTTTEGIDITANYRTQIGNLGKLGATLAANISQTKFDRISGTPSALAAFGITTALFDLTQQVRTQKSIPAEKVTLNLNFQSGRFSASVTNTYYGSVSQVALTGRTAAQVAALTRGYDVEVRPANAAGTSFDIIQKFGSNIVTDLELSYKLNTTITLSAGADNIFDIFPDRQIASTAASVAAGTNGADNNGTFPYAYIAPFGVNGATLYAKVAVKF
jgi:iron complex outermembrane receptor protein